MIRALQGMVVATALVAAVVVAAEKPSTAPAETSGTTEASGALRGVVEPFDPDVLASDADASPYDPDLAFNAALALARADRVGEAVLYIERALALAPLDRGIQDTRLIVQREARARRIEAAGSRTLTEGEPPGVTRWRFFALLPTGTYAGLVLGASWLCFGLLAVRRRTRPGGWRDGLAVGAAFALLVLVGAGSMWAGRAFTARHTEPAVVVAADPRFRDAPDELSRPRNHADLYEGGVVLIRDRRDEWVQIELVGGDLVWVDRAIARPLVAAPDA